MKMEFTMTQQEIKDVRDMMYLAYDQFEDFMRNPDPEKIDQVMDVIKDQKMFIDSFVDNIKTISVSMETKDDIFKEKK